MQVRIDAVLQSPFINLKTINNLVFSFCSPIFEPYCRKNYANGHCDAECNNKGCNWDGLDCETKLRPTLAEGMMSVVLLMDMQTFRSNLLSFLREVNFISLNFCRSFCDTYFWYPQHPSDLILIHSDI